MEPEGSLSRLQGPTNRLYPEPHINPVHALLFHILNIHLNNILPSTPGSPKWSLSLGFSRQNPVY